MESEREVVLAVRKVRSVSIDFSRALRSGQRGISQLLDGTMIYEHRECSQDICCKGYGYIPLDARFLMNGMFLSSAAMVGDGEFVVWHTAIKGRK